LGHVFEPNEGDCVVRALTNVLGRNDLYPLMRDCCIAINHSIAPEQLPPTMREAAGTTLQYGVASEAPAFKRLMAELGFELFDYYALDFANPSLLGWSSVHKGRWIVVMRDHATAWIDGAWCDAFDPRTLPSARYGVYQAWELKGT
jgi:hypothetical protein